MGLLPDSATKISVLRTLDYMVSESNTWSRLWVPPCNLYGGQEIENSIRPSISPRVGSLICRNITPHCGVFVFIVGLLKVHLHHEVSNENSQHGYYCYCRIFMLILCRSGCLPISSGRIQPVCGA